MTVQAVRTKETDEIDVARLVDEAIVSPILSQEAIDGAEPPTLLKQAPVLLEKWILRTLADAYEPRPPLEYIIDGIFMVPSLNIVLGRLAH